MDNLYHVTSFGEYILNMIGDLEFIIKHRDYFVSHNPTCIPLHFQKRMIELSSYTSVDNFMNFLNFMNEKIMEAKEFIWLGVDQYPTISIGAMLKAVDRNVKIRIIEQGEFTGPNVTFDNRYFLTIDEEGPNVEIRTHKNNDVYLFISDVGSAIAFPSEDIYDYTGFINENTENETWSKDIFNHYWSQAKVKTALKSSKYEKIPLKKGKSIIVTSHEDPSLNVRALQNAVDNYEEVTIRGVFNLGASSVIIKKSVVIRGDGREKDIPLTKVFQTGWKFPTRENRFLFAIGSNGIDVTIENIHFQDFNGYCIVNGEGNSTIIRNNRFTLDTGLGRGYTYGQEGDRVTAIMAGGTYRDRCGFPGGVLIEGNYVDFAISYVRGGQVSRKQYDDPMYRPDLRNHESYIGYGILVNRNLGKVIVRNNIIRNINARAICVLDNCESAEILIEDNTIFSDVYGAYPFSSDIAGTGIWVQSSWSLPRSGSTVNVIDNKVRCDKVNYCGIAISGPTIYREGAGKLDTCLVKNNIIHLKDGTVGILVQRTDETQIIDNKITGKAYYGFHIKGSKKQEGLNLESNRNLLEDNDLSRLDLKHPDKYSDIYIGNTIHDDTDKTRTAHILMDNYTKDNKITIMPNVSVMDKGQNNSITVKSN